MCFPGYCRPVFSTRNSSFSSFFFFNDTATTEIYTLSLHDALPIYPLELRLAWFSQQGCAASPLAGVRWVYRSEEHTSELQSRPHLVCRLLLEKKKHQVRPCLNAHTSHMRLLLPRADRSRYSEFNAH